MLVAIWTNKDTLSLWSLVQLSTDWTHQSGSFLSQIHLRIYYLILYLQKTVRWPSSAASLLVQSAASSSSRSINHLPHTIISIYIYSLCLMRVSRFISVLRYSLWSSHLIFCSQMYKYSSLKSSNNATPLEYLGSRCFSCFDVHHY